MSPNGTSPAQVESEFRREQDRRWPDTSIPALEGKTPRAASADPRLRPVLIGLLKERVRSTDERWRQTGVFEDVNWMLEELGAREILFEPPQATGPAKR